MTKTCFIKLNESPKKMKNTFYFILKAFLFSRYLNFCADFFDNVGKRIDKKATVNLKIYDVTTWITSNKNAHILQYLKN